MKVLILTLGSVGDLMPFLAVAEGLRAGGHDCVIASNAGYELLVRGAGFAFSAIWHRAQQSLDDVLMHDPARAWDKVHNEMLLPATQPAFDFIANAARGGRCVILASWSAFGAQLAHEKLNLPLASVSLSPYALGEHRGGAPVGFFPDWFCAPRAGWPDGLELAGFPMFKDALVPILPAPLEAFLQAGPPPVIFTPGSFMRQANDFFQAALAACDALQTRAIFLTPYRQQAPAVLPATVMHFPYVPLERLAARASALVHHGGIGTAAQAMRAGIPQLVSPIFYDQFDNGACITALGVGRTISAERRDQIAGELQAVLGDTEMKTNCANVRARCEGMDAVERICRMLETLA
jgi:UDP:flavonoid glycosyltransferase YjiC (YdhE family)